MFSKSKYSITLFLLLLTLITLSFCSCSSKNSSSMISGNSTQMNIQTESKADSNGSSSLSKPKDSTESPALKDSGTSTNNNNSSNKSADPISQTDRKIIRSANLQLETLTFDKTTDALLDKVTEMKGYIENSKITGRKNDFKENIQNRSAHIVMRVPKQNFDQFISIAGSLGNVTSKSITGEDITSKYFDTEAHLKSLTVQEERLLSLLQKSDDIKSIIELEKQLTDVRYQIETLTGNLKKYDNMIDYSTITMDIYEVQELKDLTTLPVSLGSRMKASFGASVKFITSLFKWILVLISSLIPFFIIIIPVAAVSIYLYKKSKKLTSTNSKNNFIDVHDNEGENKDDNSPEKK